MSYRVELSPDATADLKAAPARYRARLEALIASLATEPRPPKSKELRPPLVGYRVRLEGWRVVYDIAEAEQVVTILAVRRKTGPETYAALTPDDPTP